MNSILASGKIILGRGALFILYYPHSCMALFISCIVHFLFGGAAIVLGGFDVCVSAGHLQHDEGSIFVGVDGDEGSAHVVGCDGDSGLHSHAFDPLVQLGLKLLRTREFPW